MDAVSAKFLVAVLNALEVQHGARFMSPQDVVEKFWKQLSEVETLYQSLDTKGDAQQKRDEMTN